MAKRRVRAVKHARETAGWTAGAIVYSGRPDPQWALPAKLAAVLVELWERAPARDTVPSLPSRLGYRGCWVREPGGVRFVASAGAIVREPSDGATEARTDLGHQFENAVIGSAPRGVLPRDPGQGPGAGER